MTFILGLTGSIGMGKSTVAGFFKQAGVPVWDADASVARLYAPDGAALTGIAALCSKAVNDQGVDRTVLKSWLSENPDRFAQLEAVVHPLVAEDRAGFIHDNRSADLIVLDIPLLYESGDPTQMDAVLVVSIDADEQRRRVLAREGMDEKQLNLILSRQIPDQEKRQRADFIIETRSFEQTEQSVLALIAELKTRVKNGKANA